MDAGFIKQHLFGVILTVMLAYMLWQVQVLHADLAAIRADVGGLQVQAAQTESKIDSVGDDVQRIESNVHSIGTDTAATQLAIVSLRHSIEQLKTQIALSGENGDLQTGNSVHYNGVR